MVAFRLLATIATSYEKRENTFPSLVFFNHPFTQYSTPSMRALPVRSGCVSFSFRSLTQIDPEFFFLFECHCRSLLLLSARERFHRLGALSEPFRS